MAEVEMTGEGRNDEEEEGLKDTEGFRETLLVHLAPGEAAALRKLGRILDQYVKDPRSGQELSWAELPYLEFLGAARELRYLERYLLEIAQVLFELHESSDEASRQWQEFAKSRAGELGRLAEEFEAKIKELEKRGLVRSVERF